VWFLSLYSVINRLEACLTLHHAEHVEHHRKGMSTVAELQECNGSIIFVYKQYFDAHCFPTSRFISSVKMLTESTGVGVPRRGVENRGRFIPLVKRDGCMEDGAEKQRTSNISTRVGIKGTWIGKGWFC